MKIVKIVKIVDGEPCTPTSSVTVLMWVSKPAWY